MHQSACLECAKSVKRLVLDLLYCVSIAIWSAVPALAVGFLCATAPLHAVELTVTWGGSLTNWLAIARGVAMHGCRQHLLAVLSHADNLGFLFRWLGAGSFCRCLVGTACCHLRYCVYRLFCLCESVY